MTLFKDIEAEAAIVVASGVYRQVPLATRAGYLFAKMGGGYVRLMADGSTSKSGARLEYLTWDGALFSDPLGKLCLAEVPRSKPLKGETAARLLGVENVPMIADK